MTNGHKLNMRKEAKKDMMVKFGKKIVKFRVPILILSILLLIPSALGYLHTRINYDVLTYLPDNIETMKGQDILVNDFGTGAFSIFGSWAVRWCGLSLCRPSVLTKRTGTR